MNKYFLLGSASALCGVVIAYFLYNKRKVYSDVQEDSEDEEEDELGDKDILVLGIEGSGKTTLLESLSGNMSSGATPTDGFNVVSLPGPQGNRINLFELGGSSKTRHYWRHFYTDKSLVVFVVDASDGKKIDESKDILHEVLGNSNLCDLPFVLVAHKQDLSTAVDGDAVLKAMDLKKFTQSGRNIYPIQTQTPVNGTHSGVEELKNIVLSLL